MPRGGELTDDYAPFIITVKKPKDRLVLQVITEVGFENFLRQECDDEIWEIVSLTNPFETMLSQFLPWGYSKIFSPAQETRSPRQLIRDNSIAPVVPNDIRVWMLRSPADMSLWSDAIFQCFAELSAQKLMIALANEVKNDGRLVFSGPPRIQLDAPCLGVAQEIGRDGYNNLRSAAAWVYENEREAEQRHGLFAAEFGRTHPREPRAAAAFACIVVDVLEGARLAYQLSLSDLTREAIKAQGDLRKIVADDTAKLADSTRQVVTSVAASLATCIGLLAAKVSTATPYWVLMVMIAVVGIYVASTVASSWIFMEIQKDIRHNWRSKIYRFIPDQDYEAMVINPTKRAEWVFIMTSIAGGVAAFVGIIIFLMLFLTP